MNIIETIQTILIIALCIIVCFTDIKKGLISNKVIVSFGAAGIVLAVLQFICYYRYLLDEFLINFVFMTIVSFLLYTSHIWAGGDCKLTILISLLFPPQFYWNYNNSRFNLWIILGFTFCAGFIYVFADSVKNYFKSHLKLDYKSNAKKLLILLHSYIRNLLLLVCVGLIFNAVISPYIKLNNAIYFCISIIIVYLANRLNLLKSKVLLVSLFVFDLLMIIFTGYFPFRRQWYYYLLLFAFMLIKVFAENFNYETIAVGELKRGCVLSRFDTMLFQNSKVKGLPGVSDETLKSRLTDYEVKSVKRWSETKSGKKEVTIVRKVPFAVFITAGVIGYLIVGGLSA